MLILTPFSHMLCSNEIRIPKSGSKTVVFLFSPNQFFKARSARATQKTGCFAVYSKIAPGIDLGGTIKKRICYTCEGIDHMVTVEKL